MDLSNNDLKKSVEDLKLNCQTKRPQLEEKRSTIFKLEEKNEKLNNKIKMLEYNRSECFNAYSKLKELCESLVNEQKKSQNLIDEIEFCYNHNQSFIAACKEHVDRIEQNEERRSVLYTSTLQNLKQRGRITAEGNYSYLKELNGLVKIINGKLEVLGIVDYKPLTDAETSVQQLAGINTQLGHSLEQVICAFRLLETDFAEEKNSYDHKKSECQQAIINIQTDNSEMESLVLKSLLLENEEIVKCVTELRDSNNNIQSDLDQLDLVLKQKLKNKNNLNEALTKLKESLRIEQTEIEELIALEPIIIEKETKIISLKETIDKLNSESVAAEVDLSRNTRLLEEVMNRSSELEVENSKLETVYNERVAAIDQVQKNCDQLKTDIEHISEQIKASEDKLVSKQSLMVKEKDFLQSIANSMQREFQGATEKLGATNTLFQQLCDENSAMRNKIKMLSHEIECNGRISAEMNERDQTQQTDLIAKFKHLEELLALLDKEVTVLRQTKDSLAEDLRSLSRENDSKIKELTIAVEESKKSQLSAVSAKQKEISSTHSEINKLTLEKDEVSKLVQKIECNKDMFACLELKLKSHVKWALKQVMLANAKEGFRVVKQPTLSEDLLEPQPSSSILKHSQLQDTESPSLQKAVIKPMILLDESVKTTESPSTLASDNLKEDKTGLKASITSKDNFMIKKRSISQLTPSSREPILSEIPLFFNQLTEDEKKHMNDNKLNQSTTLDESSSSIDLKENQLTTTRLKYHRTSTPLALNHDNDSDYAFKKTMKKTNKVLLKSRTLSKDRVKSQQYKKSNNDSIILIDSD